MATNDRLESFEIYQQHLRIARGEARESKGRYER